MRTLLIIPLLLAASALHAQQYSIDGHKIAGGGGTSSNGQFAVTGTIGQFDASYAMTGGNYSLTGGFWSFISVVQTAGAPTLTITYSGRNITVSWPSPSTGWILQQTTTVTAAIWPTSGFTISDSGTSKSITITSPAGNLFFRLAHP